MSRPGLETRWGMIAEHEVVAVAGAAAIVGAEDEPAVGGGEGGPVVPVGAEAVAVGVGGTAVDEGEHAQVLGVLLAGRKDEHAFDRTAVVGFPGVGLPLGLGALGKDGVEAGERGEIIGVKRVGGEINLGGRVDGGVAEED